MCRTNPTPRSRKEACQATEPGVTPLPCSLARVLPSRTQQAGDQVAVDSERPEAGQPHPDVKSQRPPRGVVSPQMNDINSWKCFHKGVFSSAGLHFLEKHSLGGKQSLLLRGSKFRLPSTSPILTVLLPSFQHHPGSPGRTELQGWQVSRGASCGHTWSPRCSVSRSVSALGLLPLDSPHAHHRPDVLQEAEEGCARKEGRC